MTVHELAGGPINQLLFGKLDDFYTRYSDAFTLGDEAVPWTSTIEAFHGAAPGLLRISVDSTSVHDPPKVDWKAIRTYAARDRHIAGLPKPHDPHDLAGRIRFHRQPMGGG